MTQKPVQYQVDVKIGGRWTPILPGLPPVSELEAIALVAEAEQNGDPARIVEIGP